MQENTGEHTPKVRRRRTRKTVNAVECKCCGLYGMCQIAGLDAATPDLIDKVVSRREKVAAGQRLASAGEPLDEIIAVRSGAFKTTAELANGEEQVVDFSLPGELMGLEALGEGEYPHAIEALEESSICRFNLSRVHMLEQRMGEFQQQVIRALTTQSQRDQWVPLLLGAKNAEQRMAMFLLGLSSRYTEHGLPGLRFKLPMSRQQIANYLGLAMETVSRVFKRFHSQGLIDVHARHIVLENIDELGVVAGVAKKA